MAVYEPRAITAFVLVSLAGSSARAGGHPLDALELGTWYAAPDSHLGEVVPTPEPPGNPGSITGAWSGAAFDTARNRLVVWGGGHADYSGNELYAFDLALMQWQRLTEPTMPVPADGTHDAYPDGRPGSRHTYSGLEYLSAPYDRFFSGGGSLWRGGQCGGNTWTYDFEAVVPEDGWTWVAEDDLGCGAIVAFDADAGVVWAQHNWLLERFDPQMGTWTVGTSDLYWNTLNTNGVFDPVRRAFVMVGTDENPRTFVYDLSDPDDITGELLDTTGDVEIELANAAGLSYDAMADRIVAWSGEPDLGIEPASIYLLDLDAATWTVESPDDGDVVPSEAIASGTWGRFRYAPDYNVHILVNRITDPVYFYRVEAGTGPGPDPDPDPEPAGTEGSTGGLDGSGSGGLDGTSASPPTTGAWTPVDGSGTAAAETEADPGQAPGDQGACTCTLEHEERRPASVVLVALLVGAAGRRRRLMVGPY